MKHVLLITAMLGAVASSHAQYAADHASNAPYTAGQEYIQVGTPAGNQSAATNGMNGGYGFNPWQRGGYGSVPNNGTTLITSLNPSFNMGSQQFGLRSGPGGVEGADARRRLLNDLPVNSTLSFSLMAGGNGAGTLNTQGEFGAEIRTSSLSNPGRDILGIYGSNGSTWKFWDGVGNHDSGLACAPGQRMDVSILTTGAGLFDVTFTPYGGSSTTLSAVSDTAGGMIRTVQFYVFATNGDYYVNNLQAVPEPATLIGLTAGMAALIRRRKGK